MALYRVFPNASGFGCEFGNIEINEDGVAEIPNGMIIDAMNRHGFTVTLIEDPAEGSPPQGDGAQTEGDGEAPATTGETDKAAAKKAAPVRAAAAKAQPAPVETGATSDEAALDAAVRAATGG